MKIIDLLLKILGWAWVGFCVILAIGCGSGIGAVVFLLSAIAAMPIAVIRNLWKMLPIKGIWVKPLALFVAFFIGMSFVPVDEKGSVPDDTQIALDTEISATEMEPESEIFVSEKEEIRENESPKDAATPSKLPTTSDVSLSKIPSYSGKAYVSLNNNNPNFDTSDLSAVSMEYYSDLDSLGRCGVVYACIGKDIMPTEERGSIGHIKPTGWHTVKYNGVVDGNYLYNRCHLIGYQLTGENDNEKNLITGTRQFNVEGMLPFENMVADYVRETNNHVMYRVTPVFDGNNLLASGVQMEAFSVEDSGRGICFNVFVYNVQDNIEIDYSNGKSALIETIPSESESQTVVQPAPQPQPEPEPEVEEESVTPGKYAVNSKNGKIHIVGDCSATGNGSQAMTDPVYYDTYEEALAYSKQIAPDLEKRDCGNCW